MTYSPVNFVPNPESHPNNVIALYMHRNLTEVWDTLNDRVEVSAIADVRNNYSFTASATHYPRIEASGETLNKIGGYTTLRFRGEDTATEDYLAWPAGARDLLNNVAGASFIGLMKFNVTGVEERIFTISDNSGLSALANIKWMIRTTGTTLDMVAYQSAVAGQITSSTGILDTSWHYVMGTITFNYDAGSGNSGKMNLWLDETKVKETLGVWASVAPANSAASTSSFGNFGTNLVGTGVYLRANVAAMMFYNAALSDTDLVNQKRQLAYRLGL